VITYNESFDRLWWQIKFYGAVHCCILVLRYKHQFDFSLQLNLVGQGQHPTVQYCLIIKDIICLLSNNNMVFSDYCETIKDNKGQ
jgi:hypothetical protein